MSKTKQSEQQAKLLAMMKSAAGQSNMQVALRDVLTDLRHIADTYTLDMFDALDGSYVVYCEEKDVNQAESRSGVKGKWLGK